MKTNRLDQIVIAIIAVVCVLGLSQGVQAQTSGVTPTDPISLMKQALVLLEQADHDYDGHRAAAIKNIHLAVRELGKKHHKKGKAINTVPAVQIPPVAPPSAPKAKKPPAHLKEPQAVSDAQLHQAQDLLVKAGAGMSDLPLQYLNAAVSELHTALLIR